MIGCPLRKFVITTSTHAKMFKVLSNKSKSGKVYTSNTPVYDKYIVNCIANSLIYTILVFSR